MRARTVLSGLVFVAAAACLAGAFLQQSPSGGFGLVFVVYVGAPIAIVSAIATLWFALGDASLRKEEADAREAEKRPPRRRRQL